MDFRDYTYIQAIAQYKTISKAAEALYISQPSLSKFLQKLEDQIGTPLFNRINKQMCPTYIGEKYLDTGRTIFQLQDELHATVDRYNNDNIGKLRLATTTTRGYYVLPQLLPLFKKQYPDFKIDIKDRGVSGIEQTLSDGTADLAIYAISSRRPDLEYIHINTEEVVLCLSADSPYGVITQQKEGFKHPWIDLRYLANETFFINDPIQWRIGVIATELLREAGIQPETVEFRSLETCLSLASQGLGCTFSFEICERYFRNYLQRPIYLSVGEHPRTAEFVIAYRKGWHLSKAEKDFIELTRFYLGDDKENI